MDSNKFIPIKDKIFAISEIGFLYLGSYDDVQEVKNKTLEDEIITITKTYYHIRIALKGTFIEQAVAYESEEQRDDEYRRVCKELLNNR